MQSYLAGVYPSRPKMEVIDESDRIQQAWNESVYGVHRGSLNVLASYPNIDIDVSVDDKSTQELLDKLSNCELSYSDRFNIMRK